MDFEPLGAAAAAAADPGPSSVQIKPNRLPTLEALACTAYLKYLEAECAAYVTLTNLNSVIWNPVKDRMLAMLKDQLNDYVKGPNSSQIRRRLYKNTISGAFPSPRYRNAHENLDSRQIPRDDDEDNEAVQDLEKIKHFGRKCCSPCCTGAFIVEVMLCCIVSWDIPELVFPENLKQNVYKKKSIRQFLFIDIPSVLYHYYQRLDACREDDEPRLEKLIFEPNLGSLDTQLVHEGILKSYSETKKYYDFPWRLSEKHSRVCTEFMMIALCNLFSRDKDFFRHLTVIRLNGECINTRLNVKGDRDGNAVVQLMAGIGYSCPSLQTLDLVKVSSLCPEALIYLFYQDTFSLLHKYMYLPGFLEQPDGSVRHDPEWSQEMIRKHDGKRYCPWCDDPDADNLVRDGCEFDVHDIHVLDDRLFDFVERMRGDEDTFSSIPPGYVASQYLVYCVKAGDLLRAFTDDVYELKRPAESSGQITFPKQGDLCDYIIKSPETTKSSLCRTLKELLLPLDVVDSKTWVIPLFLRAAPQLTSLGDTFAYEGLKLAQDLKIDDQLCLPCNLESVNLCFEDFTSYKVKEKTIRRLKSLLNKRTNWSLFSGQSSALDLFSLINWIEDELDEILELPDLDSIKECWRRQVDTVVTTCPRLTSLNISIQPTVLYSTDKDMWKGFLDLQHLAELHINSSCWADVLGLLEILGKRIRRLRLMLNTPKSMRDDDITSMEYVNTIPYLCPDLEEVFFGYIQGDMPHSLCTNPRYDLEDSYRNLRVFEATGNITLEALQFLWQRAQNLERLKVSGCIVSPSSSGGNTAGSSNMNEVILSQERLALLFRYNKMSRLKHLDVSMTLNSIVAARSLLLFLPDDMDLVATLNVKVSIPESLEGENFGDLVSSVLGRMAAFKSDCMERSGEVVWNWKREGILTILLQQQMLLSVTDLIDP